MSPVQWGKKKGLERKKSNVKMSNIENLNKFVILQNIKRKYKENSLENNEESESFFIAADFEVLSIVSEIRAISDSIVLSFVHLNRFNFGFFL